MKITIKSLAVNLFAVLAACYAFTFRCISERTARPFIIDYALVIREAPIHRR